MKTVWVLFVLVLFFAAGGGCRRTDAEQVGEENVAEVRELRTLFNETFLAECTSGMDFDPILAQRAKLRSAITLNFDQRVKLSGEVGCLISQAWVCNPARKPPVRCEITLEDED